jgi:four helix bundle protein
MKKIISKEEKYSLGDQIRRSSRSVCAHSAEAWYKRRYPKSFDSKLIDTAGEAGETEVW